MKKFGFNLPTTDRWLLALNEQRPARLDKNSEAYRLALATALLEHGRKGRPVALWRAHLKPIVAAEFETNPRARPSEMAKIFIADWEGLTGLNKNRCPSYRTFYNFICNVRRGGSGRRLGRAR